MSSPVKVTGSIAIYLEHSPFHRLTVGDVRKWLATIDEYTIHDTAELTDCNLYLEVHALNVEPVCCGDCLPSSSKSDPILITHRCNPPMAFDFTYSDSK